MPKAYSSLPTIQLTTGCDYAEPPKIPEVAHLSDPAVLFMTDFTLHRAITIQPSAPLSEAAVEMKVCNIHMLLVVDHQQSIIGMITTEDLLGEKPLRTAMERQIKRSEMLVRMVMVPINEIAALDIHDLKHAKLGNIVETLHELKQHYAIVVETDNTTNLQKIRGIFSLWEISRKVGQNLTYDLSEAHSLAELQRDLE